MYNSTARARLGKNVINALSSAKDLDEFIGKIAQPNTHKMRGNSDYFRKQFKRGRCVTSEYHGLYNPPKLNISADTLSKIKK